MDASASIRSSYKPGQSVQFLSTKPAAHEALLKLVNNCLEGLRIYQPYQGEKANAILARNQFYALIHPNPIETGFVVFSPRHAPVFLHESGRRSWIVRMRLSSKMHNMTAIFAASLDKGDGYLWLEDVLLWENQVIHRTQGFTERRKILKGFLEHHWMPDPRCAGGLVTKIANFKSLEELKNYKDETNWWAIDLCPEAADKRRFRVKAAGGKFSSLVAEVKAISGLPDVYELWSAEDICVGRAAIQELSLSRQIRELIAKEKIYAEVDWNANFGKFRILKTVSSATARSPTTRFTEVSKSGNQAAAAPFVEVLQEEEGEE